MKLGVSLPKLNRVNDTVIALGQQFDYVTPIDWLCPAHIAFHGVTTHHQILSQFKEVHGHCLIPAKDVYLPIQWGGKCKGDSSQRQQHLQHSEKKQIYQNHINFMLNEFPTIQNWDIVSANLTPSGEIRIPFWRDLLDYAILQKPFHSYWLDEILCTSFSRWKKILSYAQSPAIKGVGIQLHLTAQTQLKPTLVLLEKVLHLASQSGIKTRISELGYWYARNHEPDMNLACNAVQRIKNLCTAYNVESMTWWGLVPSCAYHLMGSPRMLELFDKKGNPTPLLDVWKSQ